MNKKNFFCIFFLLFLSIIFLNAEAISIPVFEFDSLYYGKKNEKNPFKAELNSFLSLRVRPSTTYFFDLNLAASIEDLIAFSSGLTSGKKEGSFKIDGMSLNFPSIKGSANSFAIFRGVYDRLGSDSVLQEHLKTKIPEPEFRTFFPASAFRPQNNIEGLGLGFYGASNDGFYGGAYTSWNEKIDDKIKFDTTLRMGGFFYPFSFDFFLTASSPLDIKDIELKTGIVMFFTLSDDWSLFAETGIKAFQPGTIESSENLSKLYGTIETRVKKKWFKGSLSFFYSPVFKLPKNLPSRLDGAAYVGTNLLLAAGNMDLYPVMGGVSTFACVNPKNITEKTALTFWLSPFFKFRIDKFEVDIRVPINPFLHKTKDKMFVGEISLKTVY